MRPHAFGFDDFLTHLVIKLRGEFDLSAIFVFEQFLDAEV